jgi:hypothetical protein
MPVVMAVLLAEMRRAQLILLSLPLPLIGGNLLRFPLRQQRHVVVQRPIQEPKAESSWDLGGCRRLAGVQQPETEPLRTLLLLLLQVLNKRRMG